jgi:nucleotide-binding universal stress UspA family protein
MVLEKISKILIPIDGSASSLRAADAAVELARRYSDAGGKTTVELIALHVVDIGPKLRLFGTHGLDYSAYEKKALEEAEKSTQEWFAEVQEKAKINNLSFRSHLSDNSLLSVVGEIANYAEGEKVDIIIMGTKGRSGFSKLLVGSVAAGVIAYAPCTVMVVR